VAIHDYGRPVPPEGERLWSTEQLREDFDVVAFAAPYVRVVRKADNVTGWLEFVHSPRFYFGFRPDNGAGVR